MTDSTRPVAFVTGASRGIGKATAVDLAAAGYDVAVSARTMTDGQGRADTDRSVSIPGGLDTTVALIEEHGTRGLAVPMDLLDRPSVIAAVDTVLAELGHIDVLVNNAVYQGNGAMELFMNLDEADLHKMFEGNVYAQLAVIHAVLPHMLEAGHGTIVNMISATAYAQPPAKAGEGGWGVGYAMTKAAFARVAPLLHVEHQADGLKIFSIDPGFVITEKMEATGRVAKHAQYFEGARPEVIGRAIRWLVTDPDADELRGETVFAQREVKRRGLLPGWPPPKVAS
jgi:NAD(P)-dependent dehydrogenase (short-subunit alcohol dehydrogenase family)